MIYLYEAMDATGMELRGSVEAENEEDAQLQIRQRGLFVTKLSKQKSRLVETTKKWKLKWRSPFSCGIFWGFFFKGDDDIFFSPIPGLVFEICKQSC